ncbi:conserved hypothetical protein [Theileria orientalis strain Shintoku]|uniref:AP2/ERF domain-containing protein n=1 Tax=Theileria orientalis strain Shintoku TaxID=869250 RepID=J4C308_THEOR|nr:conserved hypothetical protein [Theileria orientalis strain Shintoku]BAM39616.1 conserved hypothetical protein [Theileria orientalis strain Shintoku]|eukprot:XP_009689917.1 conserved hypothetical protein [Theileria orientalis strain Shintoku]
MPLCKGGKMDENPHNLDVLTNLHDNEYDLTFKHDEVSLEDEDQRKPMRCGRPRADPYDDFSDIRGVTQGHDHLQCLYNFSDRSGFGSYNAHYKEDYSVNDRLNDGRYKDVSHKDPNEYKDGFKYYKSYKDYKDKIETDTRLTSSSDVLSNFNYETIDNYEVGENYETIDNYNSDERAASLNDNSEFAVKDNDTGFNLDDARFNAVLDLDLDDTKVSDSDKLLDSDNLICLDSKSQDSNHLLESTLETTKLMDADLESNKSLDLEKKSFEMENMYVISEELRQSYIRQSKLLPKIRGVWFNSTMRRMGWVGQAYKKCKRIEKIFSINKHGFEGARKLAIAFRNSQKPTSKSDIHYPDVSLKDVIKPISQLRINMPRANSGTISNSSKTTYNSGSTATRGAPGTNYVSTGRVLNSDLGNYVNASLGSQALSSINDTNKSLTDLRKYKDVLDRGEVTDRHVQLAHKLDNHEAPDKDINLKSIYGEENEIDDYHYPVDYKEIIDNYKSHLSREEASIRDNTCKEAILFMLYELSALLELDFPIPPLPKGECKRGLSFHINFLENTKKTRDILPYINSLAHYICEGVTPTDMPHFQLYSLIRTLSHCEPLKMTFVTH